MAAEILPLFRGLVQNIALLLSLVFVYSLIAPRVKQTRLGVRGLITGALFGLIAVVGMQFPVQVAPGVIVGGRNVIVALAGVFGGTAAAVTAASLVGGFRLWLGGVGTIPGVGAILTAMVLGAWVHWHWGARVRQFGPRQFLLLGAALAASGLLWTLALPDADLAWRMLGIFALPFAVLSPLFTLLAGLLLSHVDGERERVTLRHHSIDHSTEAAFWIASTGRLVDANPVAVELCGYSREELLSLHVWDLDVNCSEDAWPAAWKTAREHANPPFESSFCAKDGQLIPVEISCTFLEFERAAYVCAFVRDITERKRAAAGLRESERRYRMIVETTNEIIYRVATTEKDQFGGTVQFVSSQVKNILGYQPDEFSREPGLWFRIVHPDDVPALVESTRKIFASREPGTRQYRLRHKETAEYRWMEDKVVLYTDDHGNVIAIQGAARDITERKRMERSIEARARQQAGVAELGQRALLGTDVSTLMSEATALVARTLEVEYCKVLELLPDGAALVLRAGVGWKEGYVGHATVGAETDSQAGYTLLSDEPVVVEDLRAETRFSGPALLDDHGVVSGVSVIIRGHERPFGVLGAHTSHRREFTKDDIHFVQAVANVVATAIQRERLHEEAVRRRREAEVLADLARTISASLEVDTILQRVAEGAKDLCGSDMAAVALRSSTSEETVLRYRVGARYQGYESNPIQPGKGTGGQVLLSGRPFRTDNYAEDPRISKEYLPVVQEEEVVAVLVVPIRIGERVEGSLYVTNRSARPFTDRDEVILLRLADQGAIAIENARLYAEALRRRREAEELARVGRLLTESLDVSEVAERIVESVLPLFGVQLSNLALLQPDGSLMTIASGGLARDRFRRGHVRPSSVGLGGRAVTEGRPAWSSDLLSDRGVFLDDALRRYIVGTGIRAALAVPLRVRGKITGVLTIGDQRARAFSEDEVALLETFADRAAVALENSRLYGELRAALEEVEASQRHVVETERLRSLGELAGGVAHNFNNALAIVLGRVELLLARTRSPNVRRQLQVIEQTAKDAARTVKRIEEFARMRQARPFQAVDLNRLVDEVVELTRPRWKEEAKVKGISYDVVLEKAALPLVAGEPSELREVLTNLMFNALDAMPTGGRVKFRTGTEGEHVYCAVTDTGIGMTPEVRQRVFDPFFTTKGERGSGLGLSIVYGIIARHGGKVDAESRVGLGTTFTIRLPLGRDFVEVPEEASAPQPQRRGKILIIDDEPELLEILGELLAGQGHTVTACADGKSGLRRFKEGPFDLVITDLGMPGISGWEVVKQVKRRKPETPVALLTGWGDQIAPEEARAKGADFLMTKPFTPEEIQAVLAQALASKS